MSFFPSYKALILIITFTITLTLISTSSAWFPLSPCFYHKACPTLLATVRFLVEEAIKTESRMGASLLRLHFHDCFVNGCDGSILLNDTPTHKGEKTAAPNINSVRGFEVIDEIKSAVEKICPNTVSCADILAIAARDSVVILGGLTWEVELGRRDSKTASLKAANINIPSPFSNLSTLLSSFESKGLSARDLVALSGAHTIGLARCFLFKNRLYNETNINSDFKKKLSFTCLKSSTEGDNNLASLDNFTPNKFDNSYYAGLVTQQGLLTSDQQLFSVEGEAAWHVWKYNDREPDFFKDFAKGMVNMGRISPLTGKGKGEIRTQCWRVNGHKY